MGHNELQKIVGRSDCKYSFQWTFYISLFIFLVSDNHNINNRFDSAIHCYLACMDFGFNHNREQIGFGIWQSRLTNLKAMVTSS